MSEEFNIKDEVKIRRVLYPYQGSLSYIIVKVLQTVVHCYEANNPKHIYKGIRKNTITKI